MERRPSLEAALSNRLQGAVDEGWLQFVVPPDSGYTSVGLEDLVSVCKAALADSFGWLLAEGFSALLVESFRARLVHNGADVIDPDMHAELLRCVEDGVRVTHYIVEGVNA